MAAPLELNLADAGVFLEGEARQLERLDLTSALRSCSLAAKAAIMDNFQGQHDPEGVPWAPRKRERNRPRDKRARKKGGRQQLLLDTGLLRASYQAGAQHVEEVTPLTLAVGSNLDRAAWLPHRDQYLGLRDGARERSRSVAKIRVIRIGDKPERLVRRSAVDPHHLARPRHRERAEQNRIRDTRESGRQPDTGRERQHGEQCMAKRHGAPWYARRCGGKLSLKC